MLQDPNDLPRSTADPHDLSTDAKKQAHLLKKHGERLFQALQFLAPGDLLLEPGLAHKRWPAYFKYDPMRANIEFAKAFQVSYRYHFRKHIDIHRAESVQGLDLAALLYPRDGRGRTDLTNVHRARQVADSYGVPYEPFINFGMQFAADRGVTNLSRPNQLVPNKFRKTWEKKLDEWRLELPNGLPSKYREEHGTPSTGAPGCLGLPGASGQSDVCCQCPYANHCARLARKLLSAAEARKERLGEPVTYADKAEALRLLRNEEKKLRMRAVRAEKRTAKATILPAAQPVDVGLE